MAKFTGKGANKLKDQPLYHGLNAKIIQKIKLEIKKMDEISHLALSKNTSS
jgi:hypothetical protein